MKLDEDSIKLLGVMALIGALVGFATEAMKKEVNWRTAFGRAVLTSVLAMGGGAVTIIVPTGLSTIGIIGVSALLASLGTDGALALLAKFKNRGGPEA